ncbi:hypothetical protein LC593_16525 [Nostoc sp. CHAB 5844]|nr:hypothetical protein [Nostoc sp. CHAB 5844]
MQRLYKKIRFIFKGNWYKVKKMEKAATLEDALALVKQLSLIDKIRLIEQVAPQIENISHNRFLNAE